MGIGKVAYSLQVEEEEEEAKLFVRCSNFVVKIKSNNMMQHISF
jgi:hypothetical protein